MCGITGIYAFSPLGRLHMINLSKATQVLSHRGPDNQGLFTFENIGLGHRRLSILDLSSQGNQPMFDDSGRYGIVYNGECYNYKKLRKDLASKGVAFNSDCDTEVILKGYIAYGKEVLKKVHGFFSFAVFDKEENALFLARDRFGIKPLVYYHDQDKFLFASEIKSILEYGLNLELNKESLVQYFQLNFIPGPQSIFHNVNKLEPGFSLYVDKSGVKKERYYSTELYQHTPPLNYQQQQKELYRLVDNAVEERLVSDVPLGTFLSGGIDSSIISGLASRKLNHLHTFSIGYADERYFDETKYANLVARHFNTEHTVFKLKNADFLTSLSGILDGMDEPFADSSAIAVFILSERVSNTIKVILSGDGADEIFSGYHKHLALFNSLNPDYRSAILKWLSPMWEILPKSRNTFLTNKVRQFKRYADGLNLPLDRRFYRWAGFNNRDGSLKLFNYAFQQEIKTVQLDVYEKYITQNLLNTLDFNEILLADLRTVLPYDMLKKVDAMSMAHGLEVRVPFLDHHIVEYAFSLPAKAKIQPPMKKRILRDTFRDFLPAELYARPKKGFEVPLLKWFRRELASTITKELLNRDYIESQGIFNYNEIKLRTERLKTKNPGDETATVWALLVFQHWWKRYMEKEGVSKAR